MPDPVASAARPSWPALPLSEWRETAATLHLWTQIVGKVRLMRAPMMNHWWQVPLYLSARGLTTSPMPHGERTFEIEFDFVDSQLRVNLSSGESRSLPLRAQAVAHFYRELMASLDALGVGTRIRTTPCELPDAIPFETDLRHASYDPEYARRHWEILSASARVLTDFRSQFLGKASPVHFFWGSFDLAVTRFSGRRAPEHPGGVPGLPDWAVREAYSHEVSSAGFWAGGEPFPQPIFYSYAYPEPAGFASARVRPAEASYGRELREFFLPYEAVRRSGRPDEMLMEFLQATYEAAAELGGWNRPELER